MGSTQRSTFAVALEAFISDLKRNEDIRSPFYKEVLSQFSSGTFSSDQDCQTLERLVQFIRELDGKQKRSSFTRRISERLDPLVVGLSQYTAACDVMIQAGPAAACLIYGGARIVLLQAEKFRKCFEDVLSIMESVGHLLKCYHIFAKAYDGSIVMQQLLLGSYKNIICFWQKAAALFSRKAYKTLLTGIVKPLDAEWQRCRQTLEADEKRVQIFAQATEASMRQAKDLEETANRTAKLRKQIVDWIKADQDTERLDVRQDIRTHLETHHDNSCTWLRQHPDMEKWLKAKKTTSIWYSAGPGAGKTILASTLVRDLQNDKYRTATFFCSFNDIIRRKAINVLRSLALQLLSPSDSIPERVKRLYEEDLKNHCSKLSDIKIATEVVELLIRQQSRIHIVVDGLDECEKPGQLLDSLCHLLRAKTYGIVKWFFSSRPDSDIRLFMRELNVRELMASQDLLIGDIRDYVTDRFRDTMDHDCKDCIEYWTDNSEGCFLWVRHMLDILEGEGTTCGDDIEEELAQFPTGLTGCEYNRFTLRVAHPVYMNSLLVALALAGRSFSLTRVTRLEMNSHSLTCQPVLGYMRTLSRLSTRPHRHQQLARSIFVMLVGAVQPLRLSELTHALAAAKNSVDFSANSLPKAGLIEELCSSLVIFDRTNDGTEDDPQLKVAHKSVQDFFIQDPATLQLPDERLREFFVTLSKANLELGLSALSYLSYQRYHDPQDIRLIVGTNEHSFLQHAATFWHHYLSEATPSGDLSKKVFDFVRSGAFWTCVAVQSQIAPYLFARYSRRLGGYRVEATGLKSMTSRVDDVCYAIALPEWLDAKDDLEGAKILEAFHGFVTEWHSVLISHSESLDQCAMNKLWGDLLPGRAPWTNDRVRVFSMPNAWYEDLDLVDVQVERGFLKVVVLISRLQPGQKHDDGEQATNSPGSNLSISARPALACHTTSLEQEHFFSEVDDSEGSWIIDTDRLSAGYYPMLSEASRCEPQFHFSQKAQGRWRLLCRSVGRSPQKFTMPHSLVAYHCVQDKVVRHESSSTHSSAESGYGSMASSDTEYDSQDEGGLGSSKEAQQHCLLIIREYGSPHWHFWKSKADVEVTCASHPEGNIALWSASPHQLLTMDLDSREIQSSILPEPVGIQLSTASAVRKEFRFSKSGDILHYLLYTASKSEVGFRQTVSVSSFVYSGTQDSDLERTHSDISFFYESASPLQHPFILTHWDSDFVYIALPPLSCNTKVVKMRLTKANATVQQQQKENIQTLRKPIYFPYSASYRNPIFKVQAHQAGEDILILGMNAERSTLSITEASKPSAVMTWKVNSQTDWRDWEEKLDAREERATTYRETYEMLRGTFHDKDRRFEVTVRSGLDWRRKAFLSCA